MVGALEYLIRAYEKVSKAYSLVEEAFNILDKCGDNEDCKRFRVWVDHTSYEFEDLVGALKEAIEELEKMVLAVEEKANYWGE